MPAPRLSLHGIGDHGIVQLGLMPRRRRLEERGQKEALKESDVERRQLEEAPVVGNKATPAPTSNTNEQSKNTTNNGTSNRGGGFNCRPGACAFIRDNDPRVVYTGSWILNGTAFTTTHSTTSPGATAYLRFNGSSIIVFGIVPATNDTIEPPTARYSLDDQPPLTTTMSRAAVDVPNQPLFSLNLLSEKEHELLINVTSATVPFTISSFFITGHFRPGANQNNSWPLMGSEMMMGFGNGTRVNGTTGDPNITVPAQSETPEGSSPQSLMTAVKVLSGLLGIIMLLFIGGISLYIYHQRRRRLAPRRRSVTVASSKTRPDSIPYTSFTTPESILRHDPSDWSLAANSREERMYPRSEQPSFDQSRRSNRWSTMMDQSQPPALPPKLIMTTPQQNNG